MVTAFRQLIANNVLGFQDSPEDHVDETEFYLDSLRERHASVCEPCRSGAVDIIATVCCHLQSPLDSSASPADPLLCPTSW
jgi:hypothetical protein